MDPTRRQFLGAAAGVLAVGVAASLRESIARAVPAARIPSGGTPFAQPQELVSANGRLDVELVAAPSNIPFGAGKRFAYTYNGTTPGPTLRVRPGDVLSITLVNRLGETTNLHTHGLHVSPSGHADNVFVAVADGARRTYTYEIPHDHRSGTFWYHPHMHEMVAPQVFGGLAGVIIVEDALDELPELAGATERVLVVSDPAIGHSANVLDASMMEKMRGREGDVVVVNGVVAPTISARRAHSNTGECSTRARRATTACHSTATRSRSSVPTADASHTSDATEVLLAPGEHVEILVTPSTAGSYRLQALPYNRGSVGMGGSSGSSTRTLVATMTTTGRAARRDPRNARARGIAGARARDLSA